MCTGSTARPAGRAPAAIITFLQANLTENMAAAGEAELRRRGAGLAQAGVAEDGHGHGAAGQDGPTGPGLGHNRSSSGRAPRGRPRHVPPAEAALRAARPAPFPPRGLRAAELGPHTPPIKFGFSGLSLPKWSGADTDGALRDSPSPNGGKRAAPAGLRAGPSAGAPPCSLLSGPQKKEKQRK